MKFGLGGTGSVVAVRPIARRSRDRSGVVPVRHELVAVVQFFGRYRTGAIRDGVLPSVG
jgi:hypothetical protein